ncbi:hypothetical protein D9M72_158680 [compost metagenome]
MRIGRPASPLGSTILPALAVLFTSAVCTSSGCSDAGKPGGSCSARQPGTPGWPVMYSTLAIFCAAATSAGSSLSAMAARNDGSCLLQATSGAASAWLAPARWKTDSTVCGKGLHTLGSSRLAAARQWPLTSPTACTRPSASISIAARSSPWPPPLTDAITWRPSGHTVRVTSNFERMPSSSCCAISVSGSV